VHSILVLGRHDNVSVSTLDHIPHAIHCRRSAARLEEKVRMLELSATLVESPALAKDFEGIVDGDLARSRKMDTFKMLVKRAPCCMGQVVDGQYLHLWDRGNLAPNDPHQHAEDGCN